MHGGIILEWVKLADESLVGETSWRFLRFYIRIGLYQIVSFARRGCQTAQTYPDVYFSAGVGFSLGLTPSYLLNSCVLEFQLYINYNPMVGI